MTSLASLRLYANNLEDLPINIFSSLQALTDIDISRNQLQVINAASFGSSLSTLTNVFLSNNRINFIDPNFIGNESSLNFLALNENICTQGDFFNIRDNLDMVRNSLSTCSTNFIGFVRCAFFAPGIHYTCDLETMNLFGRDDFDEIQGRVL